MLFDLISDQRIIVHFQGEKTVKMHWSPLSVRHHLKEKKDHFQQSDSFFLYERNPLKKRHDV